MVYIVDRGSVFDAPIETVWEYNANGEVHDKQHKTTRNGKFQKVSDVTFIYSAERNFRGKWAPDRMRISTFAPVSIVIEWLDGVLAGSKFVYVYTPKGKKTGIDVYGEFTSTVLPPAEVEAAAREWLASEFDADAPAIRAFAEKK